MVKNTPFTCPKLCSATPGKRLPLCQMADLLRESVLPSRDFGEACFFPCRVGNDLQRKQVKKCMAIVHHYIIIIAYDIRALTLFPC